jgi:hypothetical protein
MVNVVTGLNIVKLEDLVDDWVAGGSQWKGKNYLYLDIDYVGWIRYHFGGDILQDELERIVVAFLVKEGYVARDYYVFNQLPHNEWMSEEIAAMGASTYGKMIGAQVFC